ncbi:MAG: lytic transglycosylase domain-containing protein [Aquamicrobium sp.]|uniref:lytic transglycosylase domain-containing protein n=1 Tax=Aquamicrobium sp. TaxID=1872579 RepID=UPI00349E7D96|nr:lytic transglycosylase domain-containing protein [Aquamicrobium sp.]MCO5157663.1 lytic transglycosylase domain-containing protein [Aquamicrobium sp.]
MAKRLRSALAAAFISSFACSAAAAGNACEAEILRAADRYDVPAGILYAVGLAETGRKGSLHPYALNIEGRAVFARSATEAENAFRKARSGGVKLIDLGCMQINHHYHAEHFTSLRHMLDPRFNVDYAARFLAQLKKRHGTWALAVARYHAGPDNDPAQKRYVCRVIANLAATGFGQWTPQARAFCHS